MAECLNSMTVLYEDNHIIAVNKTCNEIVQGDKTGDTPLSELGRHQTGTDEVP